VIEVNACGKGLFPTLVWTTLNKAPDAKKAIMSAEQYKRWDRIGVSIRVGKDIPDVVERYADMPVKIDADHDAMSIDFVNEKDELVAKILNLAAF
jgi:hypothetical protein